MRTEGECVRALELRSFGSIRKSAHIKCITIWISSLLPETGKGDLPLRGVRLRVDVKCFGVLGVYVCDPSHRQRQLWSFSLRPCGTDVRADRLSCGVDAFKPGFPMGQRAPRVLRVVGGGTGGQRVIGEIGGGTTTTTTGGQRA